MQQTRIASCHAAGNTLQMKKITLYRNDEEDRPSIFAVTTKPLGDILFKRYIKNTRTKRKELSREGSYLFIYYRMEP